MELGTHFKHSNTNGGFNAGSQKVHLSIFPHNFNCATAYLQILDFFLANGDIKNTCPSRQTPITLSSPGPHCTLLAEAQWVLPFLELRTGGNLSYKLVVHFNGLSIVVGFWNIPGTQNKFNYTKHITVKWTCANSTENLSNLCIEKMYPNKNNSCRNNNHLHWWSTCMLPEVIMLNAIYLSHLIFPVILWDR